MEFLQEHMVTQGEFGHLVKKVDNLDKKVESLDQKVESLSVKINQTKLELLDSMDEKLGALKGDLVVLMRGEDRKLSALVEVLMTKKVLNQEEAQTILAMQPFPQMARS